VNEWGSTAGERASSWPCDPLLPDANLALYRSVDVAAPACVLFRWVCQLRTAPYSYDWLDNGGRHSPRTLTPGLDDLAVGQRVMRIFDLVVKLLVRHRRDVVGLLWKSVLPAGDLFMMRKQLLTLAGLAEADARSRP